MKAIVKEFYRNSHLQIALSVLLFAVIIFAGVYAGQSELVTLNWVVG